jgi:hypothetical protein
VGNLNNAVWSLSYPFVVALSNEEIFYHVKRSVHSHDHEVVGTEARY